MLVNVRTYNNSIASMIAIINKQSPDIKFIETGIYEIGHFSFDKICIDKIKNNWFEFENYFNSYGVCDNYKQILEQCPELKESDRKYVISITPIEKSKQPELGGWRWHKWGPYIGEQKPEHEYLYDESNIDKVYVYHIHEIN